MNTIKLNELATTSISSEDLFAKANASGLMTKNTLQGLSNFLASAGNLGFRGVLLSTSPTATEDGIYIAGDAGTYTNNGGLVITVNDQIVLISVTETQTVFAKAEFPISLAFDEAPILDSENAVWSGGVFDAIKDIPKNIGLNPVAVSNDFTENINGFANFNGGVVTFDTNRLKCVATASSQGIQVSPVNIITAKEHLMLVDIDLNGMSKIGFLNKWSGVTTEILTSGKYYISFTSDNTGAFPYPLFRSYEAGTFYINSIIITRPENPNLLYASLRQIEAVEQQLPILIYNTDFTTLPDYIKSFNGGVISVATDKLSVTSTTTSQGVEIRDLADSETYTLTFTIDLNGLASVNFRNYWNNILQEFTENGTYTITFQNINTGGLPNANFIASETGTFYLEDLKVEQNVPWATPRELESVKELTDHTGGNNDSRIQLGKNTVAIKDRQTISGSEAKSDQTDATIYGYKADGSHFGFYGCQSINEQTVIGDYARSAGWRANAFGSKAFAMGQSSLSIGAGAETTVTHGVALGRGSMMNRFQNGAAIGSVGVNQLFMGNSWAHRFRSPFSGITIGNITPNAESIKFRGLNALDNRPYLYSATRTYWKYEEVVYQGQLYLSLINSNIGNTPPTDVNSNWKNITSLMIGHTEYYPVTNPVIYTTTSEWTIGANHSIGRVFSYLGDYYIRQSQTDNTTIPPSNSDYIDVSSNYTGSRIECDYFKEFNPATYSLGQMTVKWECVWVSKTNANTNSPSSERVSDANWECVYSPVMSSFYVGMANVFSYDTRHEINVDGGDVILSGGKGTGTGKSGRTILQVAESNLSETDGNKQSTMRDSLRVSPDATGDTDLQLYRKSTGTYVDITIDSNGFLKIV